MSLDPAQLAAAIDHSVLKPGASRTDVLEGARIVRDWSVGYYCVQPCWVRAAVAALEGSAARVVSVIGFPHGCDAALIKAEAARLAVVEGAAELDMVINLGALASGDDTRVAADIAAVVQAAHGKPVKAILETAALDDARKRLACRLAVEAGVAFVKTSTGFHPAGGATVDDVRLLRQAVGATVGVKASGGIRTLADAQAMIAAGANRIGTSASAAILAAAAGRTGRGWTV
jgi:deoxyribose-phosphate aldolase